MINESLTLGAGVGTDLVIPDEITARRAWRAWRIMQPQAKSQIWSPTKDEWELQSMNSNGWDRGQCAAKCHAPNASDRHSAPSESCTCGFYSTKTLRGLTGKIGDPVTSHGSFIAIGIVKLSGKIIEHETGYRSEFAEIERIWTYNQFSPLAGHNVLWIGMPEPRPRDQTWNIVDDMQRSIQRRYGVRPMIAGFDEIELWSSSSEAPPIPPAAEKNAEPDEFPRFLSPGDIYYPTARLGSTSDGLRTASIMFCFLAGLFNLFLIAERSL